VKPIDAMRQQFVDDQTAKDEKFIDGQFYLFVRPVDGERITTLYMVTPEFIQRCECITRADGCINLGEPSIAYR